MASISCRCAKVTCTFSEAQPRHSVECCCVDCYDKNAYYAKAGGAEPLPPHGTGCPLQLSYFGAKISVKGQEHLAFSKVREGADSTNAYASCCSLADDTASLCLSLSMVAQPQLCKATVVACFCSNVKEKTKENLSNL